MNSVLNPEAPAFYPDLGSFTEEVYTKINRTIKSANKFPSGSSYDFLKTYTEFNIIRSMFSECVVTQSNELLTAEMPSVKLSYKDLEHNTELIVEATELLLDKFEINLDTLNNVNIIGDQLQDNILPSTSGVPKPVVTEVKMGSSTLIGAKDLLRPQLNFKDTIDNTHTLWVPKIKEKPNSVTPLELKMIFDSDGEPLHYEHPYKAEIDLYEPPAMFIEPDPEPPSFPPPMNQTPFTYIDTEVQVDQLVQHLSTVNQIAIDLEHHSYRTYQGITCLIQISTDEGGDFIIDALAVREFLYKLNIVFTDPTKLKVLHGADKDVLWLQRDFGVYIVGLFDTHRAARLLELPANSLKFLLKQYCQIEADKTYQLADWRIRPLPEELINYARLDTHYLLYIWRRMKADLLNSDTPCGGDRLMNAFSASKCVSAFIYRKRVVHDFSYLSLFTGKKRQYNGRQEAAMKLLYKWRDEQGRMRDESPSYVLPGHLLLSLAIVLPREIEGVYALCNPMPPIVRRNIVAIHRMILACRVLPIEPLIEPSELVPPPVVCPQAPRPMNVHDISGLAKLPKADDSILDKPIENLNETNDVKDVKPKLETILPDSTPVVAPPLIVDAATCIPPYYRYRGYRFLALDFDVRDLKSTEARITAIAQGDPLIKSEVLDKVRQKREFLEHPSTSFDAYGQRKRKMSTDEARHTVTVKTDKDQDSQRQPSTSGDHAAGSSGQCSNDPTVPGGLTKLPKQISKDSENRFKEVPVNVEVEALPSTSGVNTQTADSSAQSGNTSTHPGGLAKRPKQSRKEAKHRFKQDPVKIEVEARPSTSGVNTQGARSSAQGGNTSTRPGGLAKLPKQIRKEAKHRFKQDPVTIEAEALPSTSGFNTQTARSIAQSHNSTHPGGMAKLPKQNRKQSEHRFKKIPLQIEVEDVPLSSGVCTQTARSTAQSGNNPTHPGGAAKFRKQSRKYAEHRFKKHE